MAMAAGLVMLKYLKEHPEVYQQLDKTTTKITSGIKKQLSDKGLNFTINQVGSMFTLFFTDKPVTDFNSATTSDTGRFARYFQSMLAQGIYMAPSQYEAMFVSAAIDDAIVDKILVASEKSL
jgi:glutamate-1-semialdehyde 2,1-aminomutase